MSLELDQVLGRFGLAGATADPVGEKLWRLEVPGGPLALRALKGRSQKAEFALAALEHLMARGFSCLPRLRRAADGSLGIRHAHITWLVSDWVAGHGALLGLEIDALAAARALAELHLAAVSLQDPAVLGDSPDRYARYVSRFRGRVRAMKTYALVARNRLRPTAMDAAFQEALGPLLPEMEALTLELERSGYAGLAARSREQGAFAYRAVGEGGIVITGEDSPRAILVDWGACRRDFHLRDLARLLARVTHGSAGNCGLVARTVEAYEEVRPLQADERAVLPVILAYPERVYRVAQRYYENKRDWSELTCVRRLNRALSGHRRQVECAKRLWS